MLIPRVVLLLLIPGAAFAAGAGESAAGFSDAGVRLLVGLGLVVGTILLLLALSRRGMKFFPGARGGQIKIVEMRGLGPRKSLCLVEVRGEELLLGVSADRIELISSWHREGREESPFEKTVQGRLEELK
ncbi:MAG: FliO/MopB family protein [Deltaproteobacteria bacterium]|nr:FliO/MopB family protein [Deltaproteobacteria bacterium]